MRLDHLLSMEFSFHHRAPVSPALVAGGRVPLAGCGTDGGLSRPVGSFPGRVAWDVLLGSRAAAVCRAARPARLAPGFSRVWPCGRGPVV